MEYRVCDAGVSGTGLQKLDGFPMNFPEDLPSPSYHPLIQLELPLELLEQTQ